MTRSATVADRAGIVALSPCRSGLVTLALIQRYDNALDIREIFHRQYTDTHTRSTRDDFEVVVVVPTLDARTGEAVYGWATDDKQYAPPADAPAWPGRPGPYQVRVDVLDPRPTTLARVRTAVEAAGQNSKPDAMDDAALIDLGPGGAPLG